MSKKIHPGLSQAKIDSFIHDDTGVHIDLTNGVIDSLEVDDKFNQKSWYFFDVVEDSVFFKKNVDSRNYVIVGGGHNYLEETSYNSVYIYYLPQEDQITLSNVYQTASEINDLFLYDLYKNIITRPPIGTYSPPEFWTSESIPIRLALEYTNANVQQIVDFLVPDEREDIFMWNDLHKLSPTWSNATRGNTHAYFLGVSKNKEAIISVKNKIYAGDFRDYKFYNRGNGRYEIKTNSGFDEITGMTLEFTGEEENSLFKDVSAIVDIKGTFDQVTGLNTDSGKMFRLYNAAFARFPDADGLRYWIEKYSSGENDSRTVASSFLVSDEFKERYGDNVSNANYVETLYVNVLGRDYDQSGYNYWLGNLNNGLETRYELLLGFAESTENKALFTEMTGFG